MNNMSFVAKCIDDLRNYKGKDIGKMLIFTYDNVVFKLSDYNITVEKDNRYNTYCLNRLTGHIFYLVSRDTDGNIDLKVGKLANKVA